MAFYNESLQPKKMRNPTVTILKEILRTKIKLDEEMERNNNAILKEFMDTFVAEMKKKDEVFDIVYQKLFYAGSYYSDLRISKPDEFDINLVLKFPFKAEDVEVIYQPQTPSFAKYHLKNPAKYEDRYSKLLKILFKDGYLMPEEMRKWIQSVVDKAVLTYRLPASCISMRRKASGPARTIVLTTRSGIDIDIDLVPAIQCTLPAPPGIDGRISAKYGTRFECFLVPKPYQSSKQPPISALEQKRLLRVHFPEAENKIIHDIGCCKPVIKLLKLLRDKENWKILASYYLKTVVMWMILENDDKEYWKDDKMGERFLEALKKLQSYVLKKHLPYFFSSKNNLLYKISEEQSQNINGKLTRIIRSIQEKPWSLWAIFDAKSTFNMP